MHLRSLLARLGGGRRLRWLLPCAATLVACGGPGRDGGSPTGAEPARAASAAAPANATAAVHRRAPDFSAPDQTGTTRTLEAQRGKIVVLFFYPKDGTPGCTREACAFRDAWDRLEQRGAVVLGVSTDSVASHRAFADEHGLRFPLLSDEDGRVAAAYDVGRTLGMASRVTFLIDGGGVLRRRFDDVDPAVHVDEVLRAIDELRRVAP